MDSLGHPTSDNPEAMPDRGSSSSCSRAGVNKKQHCLLLCTVQSCKSHTYRLCSEASVAINADSVTRQLTSHLPICTLHGVALIERQEHSCALKSQLSSSLNPGPFIQGSVPSHLPIANLDWQAPAAVCPPAPPVPPRAKAC